MVLTAFVGAVILATTATVSSEQGDPSDFVNPRFLSPNGEMCLVIRRHPRLGDFERVSSEVYWHRDPVDEWLDQYPLPDVKPDENPQPVRGALYRRWPSGRQELLSGFAFRPQEPEDRVLVADDGHFVTYAPVGCGAKDELLTIRAPDGSIVRTLRVRDVVTRNDQQWLCRGLENDVRLSVDDDFGASKLRATILVTDGQWDYAEARHKTLEIDLATGAVPAPDRDLCPSALVVVAEADDGSTQRRGFMTLGDKKAFDAADVVPIASQALLERAVVRIIPEYPEVAGKARIAGRVRVDVVVGRDGHVEAARIQPLPFGIDEAVKAAIAIWEFAPYPSAADATRFSGSFIFRFEIVRPARLDVRTVS